MRRYAVAGPGLAVVVALVTGASPASGAGILCSVTGGGPAYAASDGDPGEKDKATFGYRPKKEALYQRLKFGSAPNETYEQTCSAPGGWDEVRGDLDDLDDSVRLDGEGLPDKYSKPVPAYTDAIFDGESGDDTMRGHAGHDQYAGGPGEDEIRTLAGQDLIDASDGSPGEKDKVFAGPDPDRVFADDDAKDVIDCGPGYDWVEADHLDELTGCEDVI